MINVSDFISFLAISKHLTQRQRLRLATGIIASIETLK